MRTHFDVLGWLHALGGAFGVVTGASLAVLAAGTFAAQRAIGPSPVPVASVVWTLAICALLFVAGGAAMVAAGRSVLRRRPAGRPAALWMGAMNLLVLPFGTALGVYTGWVLLNDDARRAFGRPPRGPEPSASPSSSED
jgi:hypothetical protein